MSVLLPFQNFHLVARNTIISELQAGLFTPGTVAGMLGFKGGGNTFVPDESVIIGRKTTQLERKQMKGTNQAIVSFMNTYNDDSKWMQYSDTDVQFASTLQMENNLTAQVAWSEYRTGISIDNQILKNAERQANTSQELAGYLLNPIKTATKEAMSRHIQGLSQALLTGTPSSYTNDIWSSVLGVIPWINDRNNICTVDRSADTGSGFRAQYSNAALTPSLSLIDQIIISGVPNGLSTALPLPSGLSYGQPGTTSGGADGLSTSPLNMKGSKADICICSPDVYAVLKQEAISRGHVITVANKLTEPLDTTFVGFSNEHFYYNRTCITFDYLLPAKSLMILDSSSWVLHLDDMMNVNPFQNLTHQLPATAQPNRTTSTMATRLRLICERPWVNFYGDNVG